MPVLIDSNVLLDIFTQDKKWFSWSSKILSEYAEHELLYINPIIYAEISVGFSRIEDLEDALPSAYIHRDDLPYEADFLAGKCFVKYRASEWILFFVMKKTSVALNIKKTLNAPDHSRQLS